MIIEDPEYCLEEVGKFTNLVNKLNVHSSSLSSEQLNFMCCVNKLKKEMLADAPLFLFVNIAQQQNHKAISMLFDEIWLLKEDMRMYEGSLAAFFHEEDTIGHQMLDPGHNASKLKVRRSEIKDYIQEDIIKLLIKRKTLMDREAEMRELGKDLSTIIYKENIANSFMEAIRNLWTDATDAGNLL
jgi:transcriptional regulator CtsR